MKLPRGWNGWLGCIGFALWLIGAWLVWDTVGYRGFIGLMLILWANNLTQADVRNIYERREMRDMKADEDKQWQPIETAPDGVLVLVAHIACQRICWAQAAKRGAGVTRLCWFTPNGKSTGDPTHWMTLQSYSTAARAGDSDAR